MKKSWFLFLGTAAAATSVFIPDSVCLRTPPRQTVVDSHVWTQAGPCYDNATLQTKYCVFSSQAFSDNWGISIVTTPTRAHHFAQRDLFRRLAEYDIDALEEPLPPYRLVEIPGKGFGLVASRHLRRGDHIMSNTASLMVDYGVFESVPEATVQHMEAMGVDRLPWLPRVQFLNLSAHNDYGSYDERVANILATNAFDIEPYVDDADPSEDDEDRNNLMVVFPEISRINHDCRPNADYHFDHRTLSQHIHAVRDIAKGEEITISYIDLVQTKDARVAKLHDTWGFVCRCSACTQDAARTAASDARIEQIRKLRQVLFDSSSSSTSTTATPQMAELVVSLYQQEHLDALLHEAYATAAIEWNAVGDAWTATKYAQLAVEHGLASVGQDDVDVRSMRSLAADPWMHETSMMRRRWG